MLAVQGRTPVGPTLFPVGKLLHDLHELEAQYACIRMRRAHGCTGLSRILPYETSQLWLG